MQPVWGLRSAFRASLSRHLGTGASIPHHRPHRQQSSFVKTALPDNVYHKIADDTLETLLMDLEDILENHTMKDSDVCLASGVLTLNLPDGTYVINKQPPNHQIWLSSPFSGPKRFDYGKRSMDDSSDCGLQPSWFYSRTFDTLHHLLESELSKVFGSPVRLEHPPPDSR